MVAEKTGADFTNVGGACLYPTKSSVLKISREKGGKALAGSGFTARRKALVLCNLGFVSHLHPKYSELPG